MKPADLMALVLSLLLAGELHAASQLRLGSVLGEPEAEGFARAETPRPFVFPEDHGPHPRYRSEWWYLTANLRTADGDELGVQFTLFRQALRPQPLIGGPWDASQIYLGHLAVTDVAAGRHLEAERLARGHPALAGATASPFRAWIDGWTLAAAPAAAPAPAPAPAAAQGDPGGPGAGPVPGLAGLQLEAETAEFAVRLRLDPVEGVVLQGDAGLSAKGPGQASYYYSVPRLAAAGEIRVGSKVVAVRGGAWLDREWSTSVLGEAQVGWDWFALQLDAGAELMAFQLRRRDGTRDPYDQGLWVPEDGPAEHLDADEFTLEPLRWWTDDAGVRWPVAWALVVEGPGGARRLRVEAALDDQRMDTLLTYWEGLVRVFDEAGRRIGTGYMELTGYE